MSTLFRASLFLLFFSTLLLFAGCDDESGSAEDTSELLDLKGDEAEDLVDEVCAEGCLIDGACFPEGASLPGAPCLWCDPAQDGAGWSDNDGAACDDGLFCTVDDACLAGVCEGGARPCDDGVGCNGEEACDEEEGACLSEGSTCGEDQLCDLATDACVLGCTGCVIEGICYGDGQANPANSCQICDPMRDAEGWSDDDGASCDDGLFCTVEDACLGGACDGSARTCDDGVSCNGIEACDEDTVACLAGQSTCGADELCDLATDACVLGCTGCVIEGICYGDGQANPANSCQICDPMRDAAGWSDDDGASCDDGLFCTVDDACAGNLCEGSARLCDDGVSCNGVETCDEGTSACLDGQSPCGTGELCDRAADACVLTCSGCVIGGDCYGVGQVNPAAPCEICDPTQNDSGWSAGPDGSACFHGACEAGACVCGPGWDGDDCERCVVYVNGATGSDHWGGRSWDEAKQNLASASLVAKAQGCEIWVTEGTYKPTTQADRSATFQLLEGVELYGGFVGDELRRDQRDFEVHQTILSGDIGVEGDDTDNVYHVVTGADDARIDGFVVTGGRADGSLTNEGGGGGMLNLSVSPTLVNCVFDQNYARVGGGMWIEGASPIVRDCTFSQNSAMNGGAIFIEDATFTLSGCDFIENSGSLGGGMRIDSSNIAMEDLLFSGNRANSRGGALLGNNSALALNQCVFSQNEAGSGGGISLAGTELFPSSADLSYCRFVENTASLGGGLHSSNFATVRADHVVFARNAVSESHGMGGAVSADSFHASHCTFAHNSASRRGGGLAAFEDVSLNSCIVWGNTAPFSAQIYNTGVLSVDYSTVEEGWAGTDNLSSDPLFVSVDDLRLQPGSPAIDHGDPSTLFPLDALDLDGSPRVMDGDGDSVDRVDMGPYEYQP